VLSASEAAEMIIRCVVAFFLSVVFLIFYLSIRVDNIVRAAPRKREAV